MRRHGRRGPLQSTRLLATILIMAINIIAGFLIGVFQQGVPFQEALKTYTILTVGDGLVTILPSLLVSVAGGIVVTRAASKESLGVNVGRQLFNSPRLLWIAGGVLAALGLIPGLPKFSFFALAGVLMFAARKMKPRVIKDEVEELDAAIKAAAPGGVAAPAVDPMDAVLKLDELMLEVGMGLVPLVDVQKGGQLLARVKSMRKNLAQQLGFLVPSIHITDNLSLREREYVIYLRGVEIARWELRRDCLLAITSNPNAPDLPGQDTRDPAFDVPAKWITPQTAGTSHCRRLCGGGFDLCACRASGGGDQADTLMNCFRGMKPEDWWTGSASLIPSWPMI